MSIDEWVGFEIPEEISNQAAQWIARLDSDSINDDDYKAFSNWLEEDPINRFAFEELSEMWARIGTLGEYKHQINESKVLNFPQSTNHIKTASNRPSNVQQITAIILILIGLAVPIIEKLFS
jgi:ferric-dicitrate binding protein FerR (iron transport regulator)